MQKFENLKICFAHAGGVKEIISSKGANEDKSWFNQIKYLMKTYDNVYTDISYTLYDKKVYPFLLELLLDEVIGEKLLFGTDYFMTLREDTEAKLIAGFRKYLEAESGSDDLWNKISRDNPRAYLSSDWFEA